MTIEDKEREQLQRMLRQIRLPEIQGYSLSSEVVAPPAVMRPAPLRQHSIEEETSEG